MVVVLTRGIAVWSAQESINHDCPTYDSAKSSLLYI